MGNASIDQRPKALERLKLRFQKILPTVLSVVIPGLGQIVKGQIIKAFFIWMLLVIISFYTMKELMILVWIWNVHDAYSD